MKQSVQSTSGRHRSKAAVAGEQLRRMARRLEPDDKLPRVSELCRSLDVSVNTLNAALQELEAEGVLSRRQGAGIFVALRAARARRVALLCEPIFWRSAEYSPFWDQLLDVAQTHASTTRDQLEMHFAQPFGESERTDSGRELLGQALAREIECGEFDGVIGVGLSPELEHWLAAQDMPYVAIFGTAQGARSCSVLFDAEALHRIGVAALSHRGCHRLAFWDRLPIIGRHEPDGDDSRYWKKALRMAKAPFHSPLMMTPDKVWKIHKRVAGAPQPLLREWVDLLAQSTFERPRTDWPDGLLLRDDDMIAPALRELAARGLRVGHDLQVATLFNRGSVLLDGVKAPLLLIENDPVALVEAAFERLQSLMAVPPQPVESVLLQPVLRVHPTRENPPAKS
jgi:DNA-binding LacI/PurR family transcriptional regulator/DNA-binding transcriptional regulator YhcF (GntR family)